MTRNPTLGAPMRWVFCVVLAYAVGLWLAINDYARLTVPICLFVGGFVQLSELCRQAFVADFVDALTDTHLSQRDAAKHMGLCDPSDLGKMLRGEQRFDAWRIEMLPDETKRCFYFRRADRLGLPEKIRRAVKIAPAFNVERSAS